MTRRKTKRSVGCGRCCCRYCCCCYYSKRFCGGAKEGEDEERRRGEDEERHFSACAQAPTRSESNQPLKKTKKTKILSGHCQQ